LSTGLTTLPRKKTTVQKPKELSRTALRKRPWKRNKAFDLNLATWNVRNLYKPGTLKNQIQELKRYKICIVALQEIRWNDIFDSDDYTICYSGRNNRNLFGTGFLVHKGTQL
jgi:hypothetical protein